MARIFGYLPMLRHVRNTNRGTDVIVNVSNCTESDLVQRENESHVLDRKHVPVRKGALSRRAYMLLCVYDSTIVDQLPVHFPETIELNMILLHLGVPSREMCVKPSPVVFTK